MKPTILSLGLGLMLSGPALAAAGLETCYEDAAIAFVAETAGVDFNTARTLAPALPEGRAMIASMRDAAVSTRNARASGVDKDTLMMVAEASMSDTPLLGTKVAACISRFY